MKLNAFDDFANLTGANDPEMELRLKLTQEAYEHSFGMMSKAWTGWDQGSNDDGMAAFLSPLEIVNSTIEHQIKGAKI